MKPIASLFALAVGAMMVLCAAPAFAQGVLPGTSASQDQPQCDAPGYWPLPGTGGCLKIDGAGDIPEGTLPSTMLGVGALKDEALPDLSVAFKVSQSWGSMQLSGVAGRVDVLNAIADQHVTGWGISAAGDIKLPTGEGADKLGYNIHYGDGAQRYMLGKQISVRDVYAKLPVGGSAETLDSWGGSVWVQHWWSDTIRSNLIGGVVATSIPESVAALSPSATERTWYGAASLIWSPMSQLDLGLEVIYGKNESVGNAAVPSSEDELFRFQASVQKTF